MLGLGDYVRKNGFERVLIAVSGGIDSALVALIAADALGPERVSCVVMPSPHSSAETQADARAIVEQPRRGTDRDPDRGRRCAPTICCSRAHGDGVEARRAAGARA